MAAEPWASHRTAKKSKGEKEDVSLILLRFLMCLWPSLRNTAVHLQGSQGNSGTLAREQQNTVEDH